MEGGRDGEGRDMKDEGRECRREKWIMETNQSRRRKKEERRNVRRIGTLLQQL